MRVKQNSQYKFALILSIILLVHYLILPANARPIHLDESGYTTDILSNDKDNNMPALKGPVPGSVVSELTKHILRKELELEKLNTLFRQKTTLVSPWRQRRLFAYGEGNACMTQAGLLLAISPQYQLATNKNKGAHASPSQRRNLKAGTTMSLIANSYGTGGDLVELGLNFVNYCSLRKNGFTPSQYRQQVRLLRTEIDNLIEQRRRALKLVSDLSSEDIAIAEAEGKLLHRLRDLYLLEYMDYHSGCKKFWLVQNAAYINDLIKNATGGAGNIIGLQGFHLHRNTLFGGAGLLTLISGTIILATPLVGRVTGNISGVAARRIVAEEEVDVHASTIESYRTDYQHFLAMNDRNNANTEYVTALRKRLSLYEDQQTIMLMRKQFLQKEKSDARNSLIENIVFAGIVGPAKIANGTNTMIAGWHYSHNTPTASKLYAAGTTTYIPAVAFSMLETARLAVVFERSQWKLKNSDLLPSNQLKKRLSMLDNMDNLLGK